MKRSQVVAIVLNESHSNSKCMPSEQELMDERRKKLAILREKGINPYPYRFDRTHQSQELQEKYANLQNEEKSDDTASVAGRIIALRRMGKITFMHLQDGAGKIQIYVSKADFEDYPRLKQLDRGDFIGVTGSIFKTRTGELTINTTSLTILAKSLRPLPEKFHGLKDPELRYRRRYLDMTVNPHIKDVFVKRTQIMDAFRKTLNARKFLEVETPILSPMYGGANARPFQSHLNALDMNVYMRISNELYLKRLIMGGFEKVYEFSKDFRNEGIDRTHNPEFTQIEIYEAYEDLYHMMEMVEELITKSIAAIGKESPLKWGEHTIDMSTPFQRLTMKDAIKKYASIDVNSLSDDELLTIAKKHRVQVESQSRGWLIFGLFEELVEKHLIDPVFITEHPVETTPLAKASRADKDLVERFELFIGGTEFANAYSELNDPIKQRELLQSQADALRAGSEEAHPMDEDFVQAMEWGMPPTGGVGIGIDRLTMLLCDQQSIRDVILFPFMRPAHDADEECFEVSEHPKK